MPSIQVRDMTVQRRENDLVIATFGRGFYILDDYSALRELTTQTLAEEARLFPLRDAYAYSPTGLAPAGTAGIGPLGGNWIAPNPPTGAVFTYNVKQAVTGDAKLVLTITDEAGRQVRQIALENAPGLKRVVWDLRATPAAPAAGAGQGQRGGGGAALAPAGRYTATLGKMVGDKVTAIGPAQSFRVVTIPQ